jgi:membrane-associated HD superfamily phosphohydrolase
MESIQLHYPAVIAAAVLSFVIGGLWYSPILFGKAWMREAGISEERARQAKVGLVFGVAALASLVMAFNLAAFIGPKASLQFGLFAGFATGFGWVAMALGVIYLFEQRSLKLWIINSGYQIVALTLMGGLLGAWQ